MCPLQIACSNTCPLFEFYSTTTSKRENGKRERGGGGGDAELRRGMTIFRNHQKMRGTLRGWRAGEAEWEREEGREREQVRKTGSEDSGSREEKGEEEQWGMRGRRWGGVHNVWGKTSVTERAPAYPSVTYFILHQHAERGMRGGWWIIEEKERWMRMRLPSSLHFSLLLSPSSPSFLRPPFFSFFFLFPGQKKIL